MGDIQLGIKPLCCLRDRLMVGCGECAPNKGSSCYLLVETLQSLTHLNIAIVLSKCLNAGVSRTSEMFG
jgi:hypothetical protein